MRELPFCCLRCRLSLEEEYYICKLCPTPTLFQVFPQKGYLVRLPVGRARRWPAESLGLYCEGRRLNFTSICVLFIKWELVGLKSFCSKWRNRWLYFGGGLGLWLKKIAFE